MNVIVYVLILFHSRDVLCPPSRLFCSTRLSLVVFSFGRLFSLFSFILGNGNGNEVNGCVSVRYNSLFISLLMFAKGHKTTRNSHVLHIQENVNYMKVNF